MVLTEDPHRRHLSADRVQWRSGALLAGHFQGIILPTAFITVIDWLYTVPLSFLCFIHSFQVPFYRVIGC